VLLKPDNGAKPFFTNAMYKAFASETFAAQDSIFASVQALVNGRPTSDTTYSIVSGNEDKFSINASSGAVSIVGILNREDESMYTLFISASRGSTINTSYTLLAVEVADSNDHTPAFGISYDVTIFNNHPTGLANAFMRVFAIDQDAGRNSRLEYSITSGSSNTFAIDSNSGDLYLVQNLPSDGGNFYDLTVSVTDMGVLPLTQSTTFTITTTSPASPNNAPTFSPSSTSVMVPEDRPPGSLIYTAQASDSSDDHIVYRITQPLPNFAIMPNTGEVYLIKQLDKEEDEQYTIRIEASDGSLTSSVFLLNILVGDVNDNRPVFFTDEFVFTVEEHSPNGELVGSITATDVDDESEITYSLVDSKDPDSINLFSLSEDGMLQVADDIDRETKLVHFLTVSAEDHGVPSLTTYARVKVVVTDINDHTLAFVSPLQNVSISEGATVGTPFFSLSVFDPDVQSSLSYSLSPETTPFAINESTGELYVVMELDAEKQTNYTLEISVFSEGTPTDIATTTLFVTATDELDSLPALTNPGSVILLENMPPYSIVGLVGDNVSLSAVYYEIISGNEEDTFFVEPLTGIVRTSVALDRESTSSYTLTVQGAFQELRSERDIYSFC
jgi:CBS domain-containing protein